jgi:hypothetical protein
MHETTTASLIGAFVDDNPRMRQGPEGEARKIMQSF